MVGGPPRMGRRVEQPGFADDVGLPAVAGLGASGHLSGENAGGRRGHGGAGAVEAVAAGQLVREEGEVERPAVGHELLETIMASLGPEGSVIAAGGGQLKTRAVPQPWVTQWVEPDPAGHWTNRLPRRRCAARLGASYG